MNDTANSPELTAQQPQADTTWQTRPLPTVKTKQVDTPLVVQSEPTIECSSCHALTTRTAMSFNSYVCPQCDEHLPMSARNRLQWLLDVEIKEYGQEFTSGDLLKFTDSKPYPKRLKQAQEKTGETEALIVIEGKLNDMSLVACAFDFAFMGGSMGSVVGDRFVKACDVALEKGIPLVCFAASGGARMQEGLLSLMQMARTSAAIQKLKEAGLPYVVVLTHPVYGGVTASLAMLGDVHLAEPKAMIGFAGKRVIEQTVREKLEEPFQRAEFLHDHGVVDQVVHRHQLKDTIYNILAKLLKLPS